MVQVTICLLQLLFLGPFLFCRRLRWLGSAPFAITVPNARFRHRNTTGSIFPATGLTSVFRCRGKIVMFKLSKYAYLLPNHTIAEKHDSIKVIFLNCCFTVCRHFSTGTSVVGLPELHKALVSPQVRSVRELRMP